METFMHGGKVNASIQHTTCAKSQAQSVNVALLGNLEHRTISQNNDSCNQLATTTTGTNRFKSCLQEWNSRWLNNYIPPWHVAS
eukprot:6210948-Pleurochrysis_carterae.AAC.1